MEGVRVCGAVRRIGGETKFVGQPRGVRTHITHPAPRKSSMFWLVIAVMSSKSVSGLPRVSTGVRTAHPSGPKARGLYISVDGSRLTAYQEKQGIW